MTLLIGLFSTLFLNLQTNAQEAPERLFAFLKPDDKSLTESHATILANIREEKSAIKVLPMRVKLDQLLSKPMALNLDDEENKDEQLPILKVLETDKDSGILDVRIVGRDEEEPILAPKFAVKGEKLYGTFRNDKFAFEVRPIGGGVHALIRRDPKKIPKADAAPFRQIEAKPKDGAAIEDSPPSNPKANKTEVTIMVVYTDRVDAAHGPDEMQDYIDNLVKLYMNETLVRGVIPVRLRLVHARLVKYLESGFLEIDSHRLTDPHDKIIDDIHMDRNHFHADLVVMLVKSALNPNDAGYAEDIDATADTAFCVVVDESAANNYAFAHEIGHLFGCRHDNDPSNAPFPWCHGFKFPPGGWETIMATDNDMQLTRLGIWSDPKTCVRKVPAGNALRHHDARVIANRAPKLAAFR